MSRQLLMCAPDAYDLKYEINPWMNLDRRPDLSLAERQWRQLHHTLTTVCGADVRLVQQAENAPDMVFTANAGLCLGGVVYLSCFRHPERQVEVGPFRRWFEANGFEVRPPPEGIHIEGEGDVLPAGEQLLAGYLKRSDIRGHRWIADHSGRRVFSLELVDDRWYHLDTALAVLTPELVLWYPDAFDSYAQKVVRTHFNTLEVPRDEALRFACNAVVLGADVVCPADCPITERTLQEAGFRTHPVPMTEFIKSGGAAKCLTLFLDNP